MSNLVLTGNCMTAELVRRCKADSEEDEIGDSRAKKSQQGRSSTTRRIQVPFLVRGQFLNSFLNMYLNTANSGEFMLVQDFFSKHLTAKCPFVANYDVHRSLGFPAQICGSNPKMLAHYFLGVFIMYPDAVHRMRKATVVRCNDARDTETVAKVMMRCESTGTQVCSLDPMQWVPDPYNQPKNGKKRPRKSKKHPSTHVDLVKSSDICTGNGSGETDVGTGGYDGGESVTGSCSRNLPAGQCDPAASGSASSQYIADTYVAQLTASARPLMPVRPIVLDGVVTFYLNHSLQVHHVSVQLRQEFG